MTGSLEMQFADSAAEHPTEAELLRVTELLRLRALVEANIEIADELHADDFQLITPSGGVLSKTEYLGGIASGYLHYLVWEPEAVEIRLHGQMAAIRYQSQLEAVVGGQQEAIKRYWQMTLYEKRGGRWQVVWSQATPIQGL